MLVAVILYCLLPPTPVGSMPSQKDLQTQVMKQQVGEKQTSRVEFYVEKLCLFDHEHKHAVKRPFAQYISYLFGILRSETGLTADQDDVRALLVATAVYFGPDAFENLSGTYRMEKNTTCKASNRVTLAGRHDLLRHFVIAAGLAALFKNEMPLNFIDIKELFDTSKGGTGFSFTDLAANRAGIRFSSFLMNHLGPDDLERLAQPDLQESVFFPSIKGLPEGLSEKTFENNYSSMESVAYRAVLKDIENRIRALPLYQ